MGAQWGDEGKGKITDFLAEQADMVVRYQGGANAGHTVVLGDQVYKLHLVPSGILNHKTCVIGNGVVVDPEILLEEIAYIRGKGFSVECLHISDTAHVIFPYHKKLDAVEEERRGSNKIGTTKRGIGPAYMDKAARVGIRLCDFLDPHVFKQKLTRNLDQVNYLLEQIYEVEGFEVDEVYDRYCGYARELAPFVVDSSVLVNEALDRGDRVLFEGAQGTLLDIDHGTYPFVTSSHPTAGGACIGSGVGPTRIDRVIGVAKAYTSRVGDGPFPTELLGETGDWIRDRGVEYGTTTGRPRRCGWLDAVILRYAARVSSLSGIALTKLDTLGGLETIKICVGYRYRGEELVHFPHSIEVLEECEPIYEELPGWQEEVLQPAGFRELPANARSYVRRIEELIGLPVVLVSVGPDRSQTIPLESVFRA